MADLITDMEEVQNAAHKLIEGMIKLNPKLTYQDCVVTVLMIEICNLRCELASLKRKIEEK